MVMEEYTESVTDPQDRYAQVEQFWVCMRSIGRIHRIRTSTQNDPFMLILRDIWEKCLLVSRSVLRFFECRAAFRHRR